MKFPVFDNVIQHEALVNEFKGNLFEYLVGSFLSRSYKFEATFIRSNEGELSTKLLEYESYLRAHDPVLIRRLIVLAREMADRLIEVLPKNAHDLLVIGKSSDQSYKGKWHEADLLLMSDEGEVPISLKLCKDNSFVNTKSGGVRSFVVKYFSKFKNAVHWQNQLDSAVDEGFFRMAADLYEALGLEYTWGFDDSWAEGGLPELPGMLDPHMNKIVLSSYTHEES